MGENKVAPVLIGGIVGGLLGVSLARAERLLSLKGHLAIGVIVGATVGAVVLSEGQRHCNHTKLDKQY